MSPSRSLRWRTRLLGATSISAAAVLIGAELARVWRLGRMPARHGSAEPEAGGPIAAVRILREGYRVSSTRENALVNMVGSFLLTFGTARGVTHALRRHDHVGPLHDIVLGDRHIHHFIPGAVVSLIAGGIAIGSRPGGPNRWLAIPFGAGIALVLDETALLLELEDVYWSEAGVLSVQTAFAVLGLLAAVAYAVSVRRRGAPGVERDWETAARAWLDLEQLGGDGVADLA